MVKNFSEKFWSFRHFHRSKSSIYTNNDSLNFKKFQTLSKAPAELKDQEAKFRQMISKQVGNYSVTLAKFYFQGQNQAQQFNAIISSVEKLLDQHQVQIQDLYRSVQACPLGSLRFGPNVSSAFTDENRNFDIEHHVLVPLSNFQAFFSDLARIQI